MDDSVADAHDGESQADHSPTHSITTSCLQGSTAVAPPPRPPAVSLLFHDVLRREEVVASDGRSIGIARYRFDHDAFALYIGGLRQALKYDPITIDELIAARTQKPFLLTFDDGAMNAYTNVMELLDRYEWKAHFFVVTSWIGRRGYLGASHLRILRAKGHVIGSHSHSHPSRMSSLDPHTIYQEWAESRRRLSQVLGEPVLAASVPGGEYSTQVAVAAAQVGFKVLFTSEPVSRTESVRGCLVLGRYVVRSTTDAIPSARLIRGDALPQYSALILWNLRKIAKYVGKQTYLRLRLIAMRQLYARTDSNGEPGHNGHSIAGSAASTATGVSVRRQARVGRTLDGTIQFWNSEAQSLYGWAPKDSLGQCSHELLQTIFPEPLQQIHATLVRKGCWEGKLHHVCRDGSRIAVKSRWELQRESRDGMGIVIETNVPCQ